MMHRVVGSAAADSPKGNIRALKALFRYIRPHTGTLLAAIVAVFVAAGAVLWLGYAIRHLVDDGFSGQNPAMLDRTALLLLGVVLLLAVASYARYTLVSKLGEKVIAALRQDVFRQLLSLSPVFYETSAVGGLVSRLSADTALVQSIVSGGIPVALRNTVLLLGGLAMLLITSPVLTGMVLLGVPVVLLPILLFGKKVRLYSRQVQDATAEANSYVAETLDAIRTVQAFVHEPVDARTYGIRVEESVTIAMKRNRVRGLLSSLVISLVFGAITLVLWSGGQAVLAGTLSKGELAAFVFYAVLMASAAGALSDIHGDLLKAAGATERLLELLHTPSAIAAPAKPQPVPVASTALVLRQMSFAYPHRPENTILHDVSLTIPEGERIAFVGASGAGKTTLFQLLLRFYDVSSGAICLGDTDIRQFDVAAWRSQFAVVTQEPFIFATSLRENIRYGLPDASDTDIMAAAEKAFAADFINPLPEGLDTFVGEKGVRLSGGQKQRLALARALLKKPRFLLLDEPTAALDALAEHHIQQALDTLDSNTTVLTIAHRLATVRRASRIVVLEQGTVAATGTHEELLVSSPLYKKLASLQFVEKESVARTTEQVA